MTEEDPRPTAPARRRYRLGRPLGRGGMAEVFLAAAEGDMGFSRAVAVKRLHRRISRDPAHAALFAEEARLSGRLSHPNVVSAVDFLPGDDGRHWLVMEHVDGMSLEGLRSSGPIPFAAAAFVAREVLAALRYVHGLGLVHRDVSPDNVLLSRAGDVKLSDFGISRPASAEPSGPMARGGKAAYGSPEQLLGGRVDCRSDLFAAGVVLWEMLAGRSLTGDVPAGQAAARVAFGSVGPPGEFREGVPDALSSVAMRLLERRPGGRYQSADEALDGLLAWGGMPADGRSLLAALLAERMKDDGAKLSSPQPEPEPEPARPAGTAADVAENTYTPEPRSEADFDAYLELVGPSAHVSSACPSRDAAIAHLMFHAGLRAEQLSAMDLYHLDLGARSLLAGAPRGALALNDLAVHALEVYLADRARLLGGRERICLFVSDRGGRLRPAAIRRRLRRPAGGRAGRGAPVPANLLNRSDATSHGAS